MSAETEHITTWKMERFCERVLDQAELASVARHLGGCADCERDFVDTLRHQNGSAVLSFSLAPDFWFRNEHLDYDQLLEVTKDRLDASDREQIDFHLERCLPCQEDIKSFLAFQNQIAPELNVTYSPEPLVLSPDKSFSWNPFRAFAWKPIYAAAIVLIGIVVLLAALFLKWRNDDFQARKPSTPNVNQGSQSPTPTNDQATNNPPAPGQSPNRAITAVTLNDGGRTVTIDGDGNVVGLDDLPLSTRNEIAQALVSDRLTRPSVLKDLKEDDSSLRGSDSRQSFKLISPARTVVVSNRPTFEWARVAGASSYRVYLSGPGGTEVARSDELSPEHTEWIPTTPLKRGEIYTWSVVAVVDGKEIVSPGPSSSEIKFKVLSSQSIQQLNQLKKLRSHLALGVFYAREGMLDEAQRELQIIVSNNESSQTARKLVQKIQSWKTQ